jgi:hypothetical protein
MYKKIPFRCIGCFLFLLLLCGTNPTGFAGTVSVSKADGDRIHLTQIVHETYNPGGPLSSTNCGPASFALCLRVLGYLGYGTIQRLESEEQIDHARALLYPAHWAMSSMTRNGIKYNLVNRDSDLSNLASTAPGAITRLGGEALSVNSRAELDKALTNGMPVVLYGYLDSDWRSQFSPADHWGGTIGHYIAVTGKTGNGYYIVNDPMYKQGAETMTYQQLARFPQSGSYVNGLAFYLKTPKPFAVTKTNGCIHVFMRKINNSLIYRSYQSTPNGSFSQWQPVSSIPVTGNPVAIEQSDDRLLLFSRGSSGQVVMFREDSYGNMSDYTDFGGETYFDIGVSKNHDSRIEFYVRGTEGDLYKQYQMSPNGSFSGWSYELPDMQTSPAAAQNTDGRIEVFGGLHEQNSTPLANTWQESPNGQWSHFWNNLGGHIKDNPAAYTGTDGWIRVMVVSPETNRLHYKSQRDSWTDWHTAGSSPLYAFGTPVMESMQNWDYTSRTVYSDLAVFVRGRDNNTYWSLLKKRGSTYTWTSWYSNIGGIATSDPGVAQYSDGRLFVTVRGTDGRMYYRIQSGTYTSWNSWAVLGGDTTF